MFKQQHVNIEDEFTIKRIENWHRYSNDIYRQNKKLTKLGGDPLNLIHLEKYEISKGNYCSRYVISTYGLMQTTVMSGLRRVK